MSCLIGYCVFCNVHVPITVSVTAVISYVTFLFLNKLQSSQSGGKYELHSKQVGQTALYGWNCNKTKDKCSFWQYSSLICNKAKKAQLLSDF